MNLSKKLLHDGYVILENFLNHQDVKKYSDIIEKICLSKKTSRVDDLYNYEELWDYITNDKLIAKLKDLTKEDEMFYMHDSGISHHNINYKGSDKNFISWHRDTDSAKKVKDIVPYCKNQKFYKVYTIITYVSPNNLGGKINVIPGSHKKSFRTSIRNILRIFHWKTKGVKSVFFVRNLIEKIIGKECCLKSGDALVFVTTLFHKAEKSDHVRQAILSRYAPKGSSSYNYINYVIKSSSNKERGGYKVNDRNQITVNKFLDLLKNKQIYHKIDH